MKTRNNTTGIVRDWSKSVIAIVFMLLAILGCESTTTDQLTAISEPDEVQLKLDELRLATSRYHDVLEAERSGFALVTSFVPYMGYHYVDTDNVADGTVDMMRPEALVYANNPILDEKPGPPLTRKVQGHKLVAVEYLLPGTGEEDPAGLPDLFDGDDDQWLYSEADGLWTLHAWIWFNNPMGVFHPTNPRLGTGD